MKKMLILAMVFTMTVAVSGCSKNKSEETGAGVSEENVVVLTATDDEDEDENGDDADVVITGNEEDEMEMESDMAEDSEEEVLSLTCIFSGSSEVPVNSAEFLYYVDDMLVKTLTIDSVEVDVLYDMSIEKKLLGDDKSVEVEFIINGDTENSWTRAFSDDGSGAINNVISYEEDGFSSVVSG